MFNCPYFTDNEVPCPCGCANSDQCYMIACKAMSATIRSTPREDLNAVFVVGMAALGQAPQESAKFVRPIVDNGEGENEEHTPGEHRNAAEHH
jgi:hypothetical protein